MGGDSFLERLKIKDDYKLEVLKKKSVSLAGGNEISRAFVLTRLGRQFRTAASLTCCTCDERFWCFFVAACSSRIKRTHFLYPSSRQVLDYFACIAFSAAAISACAGRPCFPNKPCCRPVQICVSPLLTVTVIGYESILCPTTSAPATTDRIASRAALNSCLPPSQFWQYVTTNASGDAEKSGTPAAAATHRALVRTAEDVRAANPPRRVSALRTDAKERVRAAMVDARPNDVAGHQVFRASAKFYFERLLQA